MKAGNLLGEVTENINNTDISFLEPKRKRSLFEFVEVEKLDQERSIDKTVTVNVRWVKNISQTKEKERFHWKPALIQPGIFLGIQHV